MPELILTNCAEQGKQKLNRDCTLCKLQYSSWDW